ncbi:MAG: immunoglobulin-like domain-containing protein [Minisyncoccia bacterium]
MRVRLAALFVFSLLIFLGSEQSAFASTIFSQTQTGETLNGPILNSSYMVMFSCALNLNGCGAYGKTVYNIGVWIKKIGNPIDIRLQVVDTWTHYPTSDAPYFSNSISANSISDTSYTLKWFYFPNGVVISTNQFFLFQFTGANNTSSTTNYYRALYDPVNSYNAPQQWCKIYLGCNSSRFFWELDDGSVDLSLPPPPSITLLGSATTTVEFGTAFTDPGATATDNTDGNITSAIHVTGSVDTNTIGTTTLAYVVTNSYGISATTTRAVVVACTHDCNSNVLFLPGVEGSRLYEGIGCGKTSEEKLWEPFDSVWGALRGVGDAKVKELALDATGASVCSDIYTKEGDVVDAVHGSNVYKSLIDEMNGLKAGGTMSDWKPVAYDWRLSLDDILNKGAQHGDKIFYEEATSTPYIEQTLRALAARSKTGKVTIIAHSNGGLVTKALLNRLGGETAKSLVDKIIMVAVPQSGAPADIGSMLVGYDAGIYALKGSLPVVSNVAARTFTQNAPMAYHLLPSANYLASIINEPTHPIIHFTGDAYLKEIAAYGNSIVDLHALDDFLLAKEGGREKPVESDLSSAEILNSTLIDYANSTHTALDAWTPPAGIEVDQIAGLGVDTVAGVDFYTLPAVSALTALGPVRAYRPIFIEDGDGTVPVPSALMIATSTWVNRYWVDLHSYNKLTPVKRTHADLFEIPSLQDFIKNILISSTSTLPAYISSNQPSPVVEGKRLTFFLHSPLTLQLADSAGNVTGLAIDGSVTQDIPGSTYGEFGEVKYVSVAQGNYQLSLHGQASGTFSLDMQESSGGTITNSSTIANVPTTANTLASLTISGGIDAVSPLTVDTNGDGKTITIAPKSGEVVNYVLPEPEPAPKVPVSSGGGGGSISIIPATIAITKAKSITEVVTAPEIKKVSRVVAVIKPKSKVKIKTASKIAIAVSTSTPRIVPRVTQTASVYSASQQPAIQESRRTVYNSLYSFWSAFKKFF